jgi:hypothetical protein
MEESIYDMIVDEMAVRHRAVKAELHDRFAKKKPFRQEPVTRRELIMDMEEFLQQEPLLRQQLGDEAVNTYKINLMSKIRGR